MRSMLKIIAIIFLFSTTCNASQIKLPTDKKLISFLNELFDNNDEFTKRIKSAELNLQYCILFQGTPPFIFYGNTFLLFQNLSCYKIRIFFCNFTSPVIYSSTHSAIVKWPNRWTI